MLAASAIKKNKKKKTNKFDQGSLHKIEFLVDLAKASNQSAQWYMININPFQEAYRSFNRSNKVK